MFLTYTQRLGYAKQKDIPDASAERIHAIFLKLEDNLYELQEAGKVSAGVVCLSVSQSKHMFESNLVNKNKG